ncbi:hypothetical protein HK105_206888 [Polyrhizophydium stewartii]|uniref:Transcription elongation factor 1 homolog n=1 Tax=Polyrhizophydium stewartii TaxID=2732419 RepID=A0ABR4N235_9FUNG
MGKRKSARKPQKKIKTTLDKEFSCLFCNHENTVTAKLDMETKSGTLMCRACGVSFQAQITALSEPIDLYSDWIDACERANEVKPASGRNLAAAGDDDDDDDDDI